MHTILVLSYMYSQVKEIWVSLLGNYLHMGSFASNGAKLSVPGCVDCEALHKRGD